MEHQPIRVDQKIFGTRHLGRDMREDQVIPAMHRHQTVTGCQIDASLPFGGADLILYARWGCNRGYAHSTDLGIVLF